MALSHHVIIELARRPKARSIAVENFLTSLDLSMPRGFHLHNLDGDAVSYRWNKETIAAIHDGITLAYKRKEATSGKATAG